jgi:hypothetical protein
MKMATNKVISLVELLELILLNLPMRDLLLAQRVSRHWRATIRSSKGLRFKLFLQTPEPCPRPDTDPNIEMNPLLLETFPTFFTYLETLDRGNVDDDTNSDALTEARLRLMDTYNIPELEDQPWYQDPSRREAVLWREASWRRMFPSHPPPRLGVFHSQHIGCGCNGGRIWAGHLGERHQQFNRNPGARMWLIWDAVMFFCDEFPEAGFSASWWRRRAPVGNDDKKRTDNNREPEEKSWILELVVDTLCTWECYGSDEAYKPTKFGMAEYEDLIVYDDCREVMANITKWEAPPVSVMKKFVREAKARIDADRDTYGLTGNYGNSKDPDACSTKELYNLMKHDDWILKRKLPPKAE